MTISNYKLLRSGLTIQRDCWVDDDTVTPGRKVLVIRNTKYAKDGADKQAVVLRFTEEELHILRDQINGVLCKPTPLDDPASYERMSTSVVCKGSYALGTACGNCERCAQEERSRNLLVPK